MFDCRSGELYLEVSLYPSLTSFFILSLSQLHRGIYTSHGSIKKGNRHSEILLRDLEVCQVMGCHTLHSTHLSIVQQLATLASLYTYHNKEYVYPKEKIDVSWEKVLLIQCEFSQKLVKCSKKINVLFYSP